MPTTEVIAMPNQLPAISETTLEALEQVVGVVAKLRDPDGGCPWDLKQTHESLRPHMLEEAYEAVEAMGADQSPEALKEELGDVLLQVLLHAQIAKDNGLFSIKDVAHGLAEKLIRRHPHVFNTDATKLEEAEAVTTQWEKIKAQEKVDAGEAQDSVLKKAAKPNTTALIRAQRVSKKAVKLGFAWPDMKSLWACVRSEFDELEEVTEKTGDPLASQQALEEELGDCLFATVSLAHHLNVEAEVALTRATDKFLKRFQCMESQADQPLETLNFEQWDTLWKQAKKQVG